MRRLNHLRLLHLGLHLCQIDRVQLYLWVGKAATHLSNQSEEIGPRQDDPNSCVATSLLRNNDISLESVAVSRTEFSLGIIKHKIIIPFLNLANTRNPMKLFPENHLIVINSSFAKGGINGALHTESLPLLQVFDVRLEVELAIATRTETPTTLRLARCLSL